ncbi:MULTISPECIES: hypothetical protein [Leuconostoc]|jgi:hypothetical protein|uniref:Beta-carotene 15,15'-monooxygenase n=1 Tax=Leuconostoc falkenbergense TaxID=2766470 RepID=A0ABT7RXD1_9LACO|nr:MULTISPECIES: hypothetical protein [Leuconostoc]VTU61021.1 hypothetical protein AMBR_MGDJBKAP_01853 [Leuconostoc pseudomesenteroides]MCT4411737.1 hypothetical protein [Leuconostoc falkenbergense]MDM7645964.1 hypothetical protein [Leuconostoc falkenbergense]MDV3545650.1 hypothetical protein [Leuconostoc falkenbergense]MDY5163566.1 hypothetical protein [Leuconostoc falkenbergense]
MLRAIKIYGKMKAPQLILIAFLGVAASAIIIGTNFIDSGTAAGGDDASELSSQLMIILQFAALLSFYNDKTRHLDAWLVTQSMSRRQLLLSKMFWLIIAPIAFAVFLDLFSIITIQPSEWAHAVRSNIINGAFSLLFASLVLGVSLVIGPIWQKVAGSMYLIIVFETITHTSADQMLSKQYFINDLMTSVLAIIGISLVALAISYYLVEHVGVDTEDEPVRLSYLKWPVVIFVFVSMLILQLNAAGGLLDKLLLPVILSITTFVFVFKPKLSWER